MHTWNTKAARKIAEALKLLEEAATEKKQELRGVMSDKYTHLKDLILESEGGLVQSLSNSGRQAIAEVDHAKDIGVEKVRGLAHEVDNNVHHNPWSYMAGSAFVGMLFGCMLSHNRK